MTQRPFDTIGHAFDTRWQHVDAGAQPGDLQLEGDVVVIGTGAVSVKVVVAQFMQPVAVYRAHQPEH